MILSERIVTYILATMTALQDIQKIGYTPPIVHILGLPSIGLLHYMLYVYCSCVMVYFSVYYFMAAVCKLSTVAVWLSLPL